MVNGDDSLHHECFAARNPSVGLKFECFSAQFRYETTKQVCIPARQFTWTAKTGFFKPSHSCDIKINRDFSRHMRRYANTVVPDRWTLVHNTGIFMPPDLIRSSLIHIHLNSNQFKSKPKCDDHFIHSLCTFCYVTDSSSSMFVIFQ